MKVLIIGGYGFIGSYIAKKFYKEGHKIYIIDNLSTGNIKNLNIKHKKYKIDIENNIIEEIFKNNKFDYVVFMLKRKEKVENFEVENKMNVSGLISVLNYSKKYGVKKFIYGSSCDVYGNFNGVVDENSSTKPYRVNGFNKLIEEQYCIKWNEIYNLDTVCVRISNVYGPSNNNKDEIIENFIRGKNNFSNSFSENMWDFIYVEDVADAIYRIAFSKTSKILNLSSNNLITINDLISKTSGFMKINYDKNNYKKVKNIVIKLFDDKFKIFEVLLKAILIKIIIKKLKILG